MTKREIKFRYWYPESVAMIYPKVGDDFSRLVMSNRGEEYFAMQYTGLRDKNGKEIYEGDIILRYGGKGWVRDIDPHDGWISGETVMGPVHIPLNPEGVEVIGNIYENPELLEKQ